MDRPTLECADKWTGHADCLKRVKDGVMSPKDICEGCCKKYDLDYIPFRKD